MCIYISTAAHLLQMARKYPEYIKEYCDSIPSATTDDEIAEMIQHGLEFAVKSSGGYDSNEALYMFYHLSEVIPDIRHMMDDELSLRIMDGMSRVIESMDMSRIQSTWRDLPDDIEYFARIKEQLTNVRDSLRTY